MRFHVDTRVVNFIALTYAFPLMFCYYLIFLLTARLASFTPLTASALLGAWMFVFAVGGLVMLYRGFFTRPIGFMEAVSRDSRAPILYLRPFRTDISLKRRIVASLLGIGLVRAVFELFSTQEEEISAALGIVGPVVAIGNPSELIAGQEAARLYVSHSHWQETVIQLLHRAKMVVVRAGHTAGVRWELLQAVITVEPRRLTVLILLRDEEYAVFRKSCIGVFPKPLPERHQLPGKGRVSGVMWFSDDWEPRFSSYRAPRLVGSTLRFPSLAALRRAFFPVFEHLDISTDPAEKSIPVPTPMTLLALAAGVGAVAGIVTSNWRGFPLALHEKVAKEPRLLLFFIGMAVFFYISLAFFAVIIYRGKQPATTESHFNSQFATVKTILSKWLAAELAKHSVIGSMPGKSNLNICMLYASHIINYLIGDLLNPVDEKVSEPHRNWALQIKKEIPKVADNLMRQDRTLRQLVVQTLRMRLALGSMLDPQFQSGYQGRHIGFLLQLYGSEFPEQTNEAEYQGVVNHLVAWWKRQAKREYVQQEVKSPFNSCK